MSTIRILIVDDHGIVVEGLERVLQADARHEVVGRARTLAEATALLERVAPDLVLLDLWLPDSRGRDTIAALRASRPKVTIVALTAFDRVTEAEALAAGADAFLLKATASDSIVQTIARLFPQSWIGTAPGAPLSERERDVARLAAEGLSNAEIARALYISENTVKSHLAHVLAKLRLRNRTELASHWHGH
jgi:DNA-binding NarL/FixJ family response regulator